LTLLAFRAKADSIYSKSRIISTFAKSGNKNSLALTFLNLLVLSWEFLGRGRRLRRKKTTLFSKRRLSFGFCCKQDGKWPDVPKNRQSGSAAWLDYEVLSAGIAAPLFDTDENN